MNFFKSKVTKISKLGHALGLLGLLCISSQMAGCSLLMPDPAFIEEMNRQSDPFFVAGRDFPVVGGDTGEAYLSREEIKKRTPSSEAERAKRAEMASLRQELEEKEASIPEDELSQYARDKRYLPTDSDKLYYLGLSSYERANYIKIRRQDLQNETGKDRDIAESHSVHSPELFLGMNKGQVLQLWGRPLRVEFAGNPRNQNERWSYVEDGSTKFVYFESGKVQGWALDL